ncbi:hypothetical protein OG474_39185 [Kribbella sp. NBC_01505]|uniref:hypothetical protein n=1 Tax=Kribbella sp. NBC_01505 TaxID=2903580 RepID=UPI00386FFE3F
MIQEEFDSLHRQVLGQGRDQLLREFGADRNVTGAGVGYRYRGGEATDEPVVIATVAKKRRAAYVPGHRLLPTSIEINGIRYGVDVVEAGPFYAGEPPSDEQPKVLQSDGWKAPEPISQKLRPVMQGAGIANIDGLGTGTLGAVVRDRTDGSICVLSNNHVLANVNAGQVGQLITQPGFDGGGTKPENAIAKLKRFVPLSFNPAQPGRVDAAIAQVINPDLMSKNVAYGLMKPLSSTHPAVGLLFAGDTAANIYICDIGTTLDLLNVEFLHQNAVRKAELGMKVDKVGRTTRYTAAVVTGLDHTIQVEVRPGTSYWITGVHQVNSFGWAGDSGSLVCAGGNADHPVWVVKNGCFVFPVIPDMLDLPDTEGDPALADRVRDEFLSMSVVGRRFVELLYLNSEQIVDRASNAVVSQDEKISARQFYYNYREGVEKYLNDYVLTISEKILSDAESAMYSFSLHATGPEAEAAENIFRNIISRTKGMDHYALMQFLNNVGVYQEIEAEVAKVPTLIQHSSVGVRWPK